MNYVSFATNYIGVHEGSSKHKYIVDEYNKIKPLPRGYRVRYNDAWCATFVSFVLLKCNAKNAPFECGVTEMYKKAVKYGEFIAKSSTPKANDIIFYNWDSNSTLDHVGIIASISGNTLRVIEGNKNDAVGVRYINKNSKYIFGYARVPQNTKNYENAVKLVIAGYYGNGSARVQNMLADGFSKADIEKVQKMVNERLKKK